MNENIVIGSNLLETITSALYENPIILFREYVQNSLDAYNEATKQSQKAIVSGFKVDIQIERETRLIVIRDNGYGIEGEDLFRSKMMSFGNSDKADRTQFIGFRGIGRMAALPYCKTLTFINKAAGSGVENICVWQGEAHKKLLQADSTLTFQELVKQIISFDEKPAGNRDEHYFKVIIDGYSTEIDETLSDQHFEQNLRKLLPIKYSDDFTAAQKIIARYKEFMNEDLTDFMCSVYLDGNQLFKNYTDDQHVLESNIQFWEIRGKGGEKGQAGEKMGILWFTFNRKITSTSSQFDYGILVRSKNVLMGGNDTFADLCHNSREHVGTYSELTGTLRGVYGELLINSAYLKDNARREWFKTDEYSIFLKYIIVNFMKHLYKYRYAASYYYRKSRQGNATKPKEELKKALVELIDTETNAVSISDFYDDEAKEATDNEPNTSKDQYQYADEDIPRLSETKKKNYDELLRVISAFFEKEQMLDVFLKLRAYIKKHFQESQ